MTPEELVRRKDKSIRELVSKNYKLKKELKSEQRRNAHLESMILMYQLPAHELHD